MRKNGVRRPRPEAPKCKAAIAQSAALTRNLHGKPRDALGRRAAEGVPDSQSASERGASAKREKPPRTRPASSGGQLTQRSERDAGRAQARAALERNEALVWERIFGRKSKTSRAGSCRSAVNIPRRQGVQPNAPPKKKRAQPLLPSTPPRPSPPLLTPHGPPTSSQSGYQRAVLRRGVGVARSAWLG